MTAQELQLKIFDLRKAYQAMSGQPAGQEILADLAIYCKAYESCFSQDERVHARLEGRRDVWLHIQQHLKLSDDELYRIATGGHNPPSQMREDDE